MTWLAAYALDDEALASASNPGLVRRAAKLLAGESPTWVSKDDKAGVVALAGFQVRLDAGGIQKARCPCPAAGVCVHALAAALFARTEAPAATHPAPREPEQPPAIPDSLGEARTPEALTKKQRAVIQETRDEFAAAVTAGLSHIRPDGAGRIVALATDARVAGLPLLARFLATAGELADSIASRSDTVSEQELTAAMSQAWALTRALEAADAKTLPSLRGVARRSYSADRAPDSLELFPLGAAWWVSDSGARGITMLTWDETASEPRSVTSARPAGADPGFVRSASTMAFFDAPLTTLLTGSFQVLRPRLSEDGVLSTTAGGVRTGAPGFPREKLAKCCAALPLESITPVGFQAVERPFALLEVKGFGQLGIDESAQQLVWKLDGPNVALRQQVTPDTEHRAETLLALEAAGAPVEYVLAQRNVVRSVAVWEPVSLFLRGKDGLDLFAIDFHRPRQSGILSKLQHRWRLWLTRFKETPALAPPRPPIAIAADEAQELVVALTATGRPALSSAGKTACEQLATRLDDLALPTLATAVRHLADEPNPEVLLRTHFLATRVAALATVAQ
jgi:hypothetical protein